MNTILGAEWTGVFCFVLTENYTRLIASVVILFLKRGTDFVALSYILWPTHLTENPPAASIFLLGGGKGEPSQETRESRVFSFSVLEAHLNFQLHCSGRKSPNFPAFYIFFLSACIFKVIILQTAITQSPIHR